MGLYVFVIALLLTLTDLLLLEKKYNLFSGGFLQDAHLSGAGERLHFLGMLLGAELLLAGFFSQLVLLLGSWRRLPLQMVNYLFVVLYGGVSLLLVVLRYQILSYFGDFMSMAVVRNLGGGSLAGALLYAINEAFIVALGLLLAVLGAVLAWKVLGKRWGRKALPTDRHFRLRSGRRALWCLAGLLAIVPAAQSMPAAKKNLPRVTAYAIANGLLEMVAPSEAPGLVQFMQQHYRAAAAAGPQEPAAVSFGARKDNLLLVVAESTRADVIDASAGGQAVTPHWRALGAEGVVGRQYFSHTGFTTSSLKAIFRGSLGQQLPLGDTLFGVLKAQGYQIVVLSGQDESFGEIDKYSRSRELADIFFDARSAVDERVFVSASPGSAALSNERLLAEFDRIAERIDWKRPVFLYVNLQAAHFPYYHKAMPKTLVQQPLARHEIASDKRGQLQQTYLNAVAYSDWATGELVKRLRQREVYQRTLVVAAGDHGESLFDDGVLGHGMQVSDTQMHAMLVANRPLPEFARLLGQTELAAAMLRNIGARIQPPAAAAGQGDGVLQVVGVMSAPQFLGYRYSDDTRLTVNQGSNEVSAPWLAQPLPLNQVRPGTREYSELLRLIGDWQRQ
ncbi:LTA synthase family protein [Pseudoduganella sp.]|uniref:LTA synthase family protein n=1 Tax=Pseudoduganella sp. TaxID=1880898 RepID=UPI0035B14233